MECSVETNPKGKHGSGLWAALVLKTPLLTTKESSGKAFLSLAGKQTILNYSDYLYSVSGGFFGESFNMSSHTEVQEHCWNKMYLFYS